MSRLHYHRGLDMLVNRPVPADRLKSEAEEIAELKKRVATLESLFKQGVVAIDQQFDSIEKRLSGIEKRLDDKPVNYTPLVGAVNEIRQELDTKKADETIAHLKKIRMNLLVIFCAAVLVSIPFGLLILADRLLGQ